MLVRCVVSGGLIIAAGKVTRLVPVSASPSVSFWAGVVVGSLGLAEPAVDSHYEHVREVATDVLAMCECPYEVLCEISECHSMLGSVVVSAVDCECLECSG